MSRPIDSENLYKFLTDQRVKERGAYSKGENTGLDIARSALRNEQIAPTLTPQNEWVSVEERLPEKHNEYIVCACDEGEPIDERIWGDTVVVCADYYDGAFTWHEGNTEYDISDIVTHWMPLPAPPDRRPPERQEDTDA